MKVEDPELLELPPFPELNAVAPQTTGTVDDDDEPEDDKQDHRPRLLWLASLFKMI